MSNLAAVWEQCNAIEEEEAWRPWSTVMDTTELGRHLPFMFWSDNNRSVRKSRHVESGPPEFATAVDRYCEPWVVLDISKATYRPSMANRWKVCISETFAEIHSAKLEMLIVALCMPLPVKEPDSEALWSEAHLGVYPLLTTTTSQVTNLRQSRKRII